MRVFLFFSAVTLAAPMSVVTACRTADGDSAARAQAGSPILENVTAAEMLANFGLTVLGFNLGAGKDGQDHLNELRPMLAELKKELNSDKIRVICDSRRPAALYEDDADKSKGFAVNVHYDEVSIERDLCNMMLLQN